MGSNSRNWVGERTTIRRNARLKFIIDCKQLVLFLIVPLTYEIVDDGSALPLTTIILAAGACSALVGIGQYSILHYDNLGQRPRSTQAARQRPRSSTMTAPLPPACGGASQ